MAAILSAILEFVIAFVSNFHNRRALSLRTIQWTNERSLYINKRLNYSQLQWFTAAILSANLEFVIGFLSNSYRLCPVLFHSIHKESTSQTVFLRSTRGICTQTHTQSHTKTHTQTQTHTHDYSIRRNAMICILPKNRHRVYITMKVYNFAFNINHRKATIFGLMPSKGQAV